MGEMNLDQALNRLTAISRHWTIKRFIADDRDAYEVTAWSAAKSPGRRIRVQRRDRIDAVLAAINELTGTKGRTKTLKLVGCTTWQGVGEAALDAAGGAQ